MIWNPWRRIRELEAELRAAEKDRDAWRHSALLASDRYEKIRDTNLQLRDALNLYRNDTPVPETDWVGRMARPQLQRD